MESDIETESLHILTDEHPETNTLPSGEEPFLPKGSTLGALGNLSNTILGAGMLGLPLAIKSAGLVLGGLLIVFAVNMSMFGLHLLSIGASYVPRKETENFRTSYFAVASVTFPKASILIDMAVAIKCFGVSISYLIVTGQLMVAACKQFQAQNGWPDNYFLLFEGFWVGVSMAICIPISIIKRLDSLKYISYFALCTVIYILVIIILNLFTNNHGFFLNKYKLFELNVETISNLSVFVFAFTCHQNLFSVFNDLHGDKEGVNIVVIGSNLLALSVYIVISYCGYLTYADEIENNIILNFPQTVPTFICRIAVCILVLLSYPLQIHPCRISLTNLLKALIPPTYFNKLSENMLHFGISFVLWVLTFLIAYFVGSNLTIVLAIVGATGSTTLCYILPGAFYVKLKWEDPWTVKKVLALMLAIFGVVIMIISLVFVVINAVTKKKVDH